MKSIRRICQQLKHWWYYITRVEYYEGHVDKIVNDTAYITLCSEYDKVLFYGTYSALLLQCDNIFEGSTFSCIVRDKNGLMIIHMWPKSKYNLWEF